MEQTAKKRSNSKTPKKFFLTWENYLRLIDNLAYRIKKSGIKIDYIYGPCRGGYIPAVILSHKFNIPIVKDKLQGNLLFVDDIIDTGETVEETKKCWGGWFDKIYTASIYKHKKCKFKPDFYCGENTDWVVFPYESYEKELL